MGKAKQGDWRKAAAAPIVFISGPEEYLAGRAIRSIREQLKKLDSSLEIHELDAAEKVAGSHNAANPHRATDQVQLEKALWVKAGHCDEHRNQRSQHRHEPSQHDCSCAIPDEEFFSSLLRLLIEDKAIWAFE